MNCEDKVGGRGDQGTTGQLKGTWEVGGSKEVGRSLWTQIFGNHGDCENNR